MKASSLHLWTSVFVDCEHPRCTARLLSYDNKLFPQADVMDCWNLTDPSTLAEDIVADLDMLESMVYAPLWINY